ncbi:MAG: Cys-tRNA(Pro) deacylase [Planctomycetia bacterium]|nr:Cys-tRNA(Pro) deacylase [Planctomycetia bacterium]
MTPAIRAAEAAQVAFRVHRYAHDADAESFGLEAAEKLGVPPERLFKTLIVQLDGKQLALAAVPANARLDLKKLARAAGAKKADLADPSAAERATGYVVGGISPLGGKKRLPAYVDETVLQHAAVLVSAGQRGLQIELAPDELLRLTGGRTAPLTV